ncbi:MAG: uracil-DNA glycosylase [Rhodospirillales bacterium]|nr:uracil-DNA glycosylase [Alphaproteobacteria bacterium]MCB9986317.1 uracil-DNA glycosylase [Rhodospirillales bacterium]USO08618.1 MAG: uracil-DNA glycosylase [Rhodospirillales bacterium]
MGHPFTHALQWHLDNGVEVAVDDAPVNRTAKKASPQPMTMSGAMSGATPGATPGAAGPVPASTTVSAIESSGAYATARRPAASGSHAQAVHDAATAARAAMTLEDLRTAIRDFDGLDVKRTATNMVFADGNPGAPVMVIGEAPGADEDRQGLPFVGVSGQLLDRMFACIDLARGAQDAARALYISNILNWRPPGNRTPSEAEIQIALPFIERHIALIRPRFLVLAGAVAAKGLMATDQSISRLRGKFYTYKPVTPDIGAGLEPFSQKPRILPTYHPSFLLRTPVQKRKAWQDLLLLSQELAALPQ